MRADLDAKGLEAAVEAVADSEGWNEADMPITRRTAEAAIRPPVAASGAGEASARIAELERMLAAVRDDAMRADNDLCAAEARAETAEAELAKLRATPRPPVAGSEVVAEPVGFIEPDAYARLRRGDSPRETVHAVTSWPNSVPLYASPVPLAAEGVGVTDLTKRLEQDIARLRRSARGDLHVIAGDIREAISALTPAPAGWRDTSSGMQPAPLLSEPAHVSASPAVRDAEKSTAPIPDDVARLVVAARIVAFGDADDAALRELDFASEAFASRVPWDDAPLPSKAEG